MKMLSYFFLDYYLLNSNVAHSKEKYKFIFLVNKYNILHSIATFEWSHYHKIF